MCEKSEMLRYDLAVLRAFFCPAVTPEEALFKSIDRNDLRKMFDENGIEYEASVTDEELM